VPPQFGSPEPQLVFLGTEDYTTPQGDWTRYLLAIQNWHEYPAELFEISTAYPCGLNPSAARTNVDIHNALKGSYIYGFCALPSPEWLTELWFAMPRGTAPPPEVQVVMRDQLTGTEYHSTIVRLDP
jgi:hypothetical protein